MIKIKRKIKDVITESHGGSYGVESVILSPLMFITFITLLYFFFMTLTFISYSNVANSIAQDLNMRQSGFRSALGTTAPNMVTSRDFDNGDVQWMVKNASEITEVYPETNELLGGTYYTLNKYHNQFIIPFTELTGIRVETARPVRISDGSRMAGNVIKVEIYYKTMAFGRSGRGLIPMKAIGHGVIA